jgi:murein L,D-transpeptidase YafK
MWRFPSIPSALGLLALLLTSRVVRSEPSSPPPALREALQSKRETVRALFQAQGLDYPPRGVFLRVFKLDQELELWGERADGQYVLVKTYRICASSGVPGPKRVEGDGQVPEGFYSIAVYNPRSSFHLSLGIDYPNRSDRIRSGTYRPGGAIMIHGNCVTIGCVPITDPMIDEVFLAAWEAHTHGQRRVEAHFFPGRLNEAGWDRLLRAGDWDASHISFWRELQPGFDAFEHTHRPPLVSVEADGRYRITRAGGG